MAKAGRGSEQAMIRLPDGMRDRIKEAAERGNRSMNAEIVARLEMAENVEKLLADFELAKQRILTQDALEKDLKKNAENMYRLAASAQDINRQLIQVLMRRLGVTEEEITAITRSSGAAER